MLNRILFALAVMMLPILAIAHGGGTDANGCHTNKQTGEHHCHTPKGAAPQNAPTVTPTPTAASSPAATTPTTTARNGLIQKDYEGFTVWLDCSKRGAVKFRYNAQRDNGNEKRAENFALDPTVPSDCQQTSAKAYGQNYDRGHLVPANHLDHSATAIKQSNYMTNILPQAANMNRGAWLQTEEIVECYRDIDELLVIGGVIWGNNASDDYFVASHGVKTPDAFWKFIIRGKTGSERVIAWIVPNSSAATRKMLDSYLVTPAEIERLTGEKLPVPEYLRNEKPSSSWVLPIGCEKG